MKVKIFDELVQALVKEGFSEEGVSRTGSLFLGMNSMRDVGIADFLVQHVARSESIRQKIATVSQNIFITDYSEAMSVVVASKNAINKRLYLLDGDSRIGPVQFTQLQRELVAEGFSTKGEAPHGTITVTPMYLKEITLADFIEGQVIRRESYLRGYPFIGKQLADSAFADVGKVIAAAVRATTFLLETAPDPRS